MTRVWKRACKCWNLESVREDCFAGTIYEGLSLDDLYRLGNCGMSYDDLYEFWMGACAGEESDLYLQYLEEEEAPSEKLQVLAGTDRKDRTSQ